MKNNKIYNPETVGAIEVRQKISILLTDMSVSEEVLDKIREYLAAEEEVEARAGGESEDKNEVLQAVFLSALQQARAGRSELTPVSMEEIEQRWTQLAFRLGLNPDMGHYRASRARLVRKPALWRVVWRVAAVFIPAAVVVGAHFWYGSGAGGDVEENAVSTDIALAFVAIHTVEAGPDSVQHIVLSDGTEVTLNRNSTLAYNDSREAELSGEAYFQVTHDESKPFVVHAGEMDVTVLGTEFDVRARRGENFSEVFLVNGSVAVSAGGGGVRLEPGQKFLYDHGTGRTTVEDGCAYVDWRMDIVNAEDCTLDELLRMIGRYYGKTIEFEADWVADGSRFATKFGREHNALQVIGSLSRLTGAFDYHEEGNTIYINKR